MISLAILLISIGFYACYLTSEKTKFKPVFGWEWWLKDNEKPANFMGIFFMLLGSFLFMYLFNLGVGIFSSIIAITIAGSFIILFTPLRIFKFYELLSVLVVCFLLEILL
ncbi:MULTISPECIES: hypothetical protein [Mesonia]|uniref:Uncharacterized protein n=1 Tax=Mesonia oceanica TaxID=2687242 RepID=A0AC61YA10_9FLAO|nr:MULTISPECIES: hypothetical protein [Mesonia]MAN26668.1 hypothetical protein [Mesonia sp.]MAQ40055.1 hypothetical protein [Mesonia sp.]MBJ96643.1 hypothetical protein [Flavobacteriaceae bacterium]VVV01337.1 hypothetical protein FVB9532_02627 [Mesonia oceanica]